MKARLLVPDPDGTNYEYAGRITAWEMRGDPVIWDGEGPLPTTPFISVRITLDIESVNRVLVELRAAGIEPEPKPKPRRARPKP